MKNGIKISTWETWKKNNKPVMFSIRDGVKGWAVQTVVPTLKRYGFFQIYFDTDYNYSENARLKDIAMRVIENFECRNDIGCDKFEFVYHLYRGTNGYQDAFYVFAKPKNEYPDLIEHCLNCGHYTPNPKTEIGHSAYQGNGFCKKYNCQQFPYSKCNEYFKNKKTTKTWQNL